MFYILSNIILHLIKFSYLVDLSFLHLYSFRLFHPKSQWFLPHFQVIFYPNNATLQISFYILFCHISLISLSYISPLFISFSSRQAMPRHRRQTRFFLDLFWYRESLVSWHYFCDWVFLFFHHSCVCVQHTTIICHVLPRFPMLLFDQ